MFFLPMLLGLSVADAATFTVSNRNQLTTAVNQLEDGDVIQITSGTHIQLNSTLTLSGVQNVLIVGLGENPQSSGLYRNGSGNNLVEVIGGASVQFENLTLNGTSGRRVLRVTDGSTISLDEMRLINGQRNSTGGILSLSNGSTASIDSSVFRNGTVTGNNDGGLIYVSDASLNVLHSQFELGTARSGGAISIHGGSAVHIDHSEFSQNSANGNASDRGGGAIYVSSASANALTIVHSTFRDNTAPSGVGGAIFNRSTTTIEDSHFDLNQAQRRGGHVHSRGGSLTIERSTFLAGVSRSGGAVSWTDGADAHVLDSGFWENVASIRGGALHADDVTLHATRNLLCDNSVLAASEAWSDGGGGLSLREATGLLHNNIFMENYSALAGGAIHVNTSNSRLLDADHQHFIQNLAPSGSAVYAFGGTRHEVKNSLFLQNYTWDSNGAQTVRGAMTESNCAARVDLDWSAFFNNSGAKYNSDCVDSHDELLPESDPLLLGEVSEKCGPLLNLAPSESSPLHQSGENNSTIGAFDGPHAGFIDEDEDGLVVIEDCDDTDPNLPGIWYRDYDLDGFGAAEEQQFFDCGDDTTGYVPNNLDCDDTDATIYPGAPEICNGKDNDCDGTADNGLPEYAWWPDNDNDGFGDSGATPEDSCKEVRPGYAQNNLDCDDSNPNIHPNAVEICDNIDNNCNNQIDEGLPTYEWWPDLDGDGFGDLDATPVISCFTDLPNHVQNGLDCDDSNPQINPDAEEVCDEIDNNCNDLIDEGLAQIWYMDLDGDTYGDDSTATETCNPADGMVLIGGDCDDSNPDVHPDAVEICDDIDNNCDGQINEGLNSYWYLDSDGDGFGDTDSAIWDCDRGNGMVQIGGDCDDTDPDIGLPTTWYLDSDGDGFGNAELFAEFCEPAPGYVNNALDCDDSNPLVYPGADEICDGIDNNCNDLIDEGLEHSSWYLDADGDGYGAGEALSACDGPEGYVDNDGDCDDTNSAIHPDAEEICDNVDNNCDDLIDLLADGTDVCEDDTEEEEPGPDQEPSDREPHSSDGAGAGCGCTSSPSLGGSWLGLGLIGLLLRRRRSALR